MTNILIIEDNNQLRKYLAEYLQAYSFTPHFLDDYDKLPQTIAQVDPKLILLDITLPRFDGFYYLRIIRKHSQTPVIILSARSDEADQIRGIEGGAYDYITKPFSAGVLIAKINSLLSREPADTPQDVLQVGEVALCKSTMALSHGEATVQLSKNEYKMLALLLENSGKFVTREEMLEALWDSTTFIDDNTLTVNISRAKKRLSDIGLENAIVTKRGVGYAFVAAN